MLRSVGKLWFQASHCNKKCIECDFIDLCNVITILPNAYNLLQAKRSSALIFNVRFKRGIHGISYLWSGYRSNLTL